MPYSNTRKIANLGVMSLLALQFLSAQLFAQEKLQGMIKARSAATIILGTKAELYVNVLLEDTTKVAQNEGLLKASSGRKSNHRGRLHGPSEGLRLRPR